MLVSLLRRENEMSFHHLRLEAIIGRVGIATAWKQI